MNIRFSYILRCLLGGVMFTSLAACSHDDAATLGDGDTPVAFSTNFVSSADTLATRAGRGGFINTLDDLKRTGYYFGVFACFTDTEDWHDDTDNETGFAPNFMYNQQVEWNYIMGTEDQYVWSYTPVKYWPNYNENVPRSNVRKLSFFAYAPYASLDDVKASASTSTGIVDFSPNDVPGAPWVEYRAAYDDYTQQVDLMWAKPKLNCYKTMDEGYGHVDGKVPLEFAHALSSVEVWVQRVYNEKTPTGRHPDNETDTKIFVSSLTLTPSNALMGHGRMSLLDGQWRGLTPQSPKVGLTYTEAMMDDKVGGTASASPEIIGSAELRKWGLEGYGVTEEAKRLCQEDRTFFFIPQEGVTLTPTITYSFVTRDDTLGVDYLAYPAVGTAANPQHRYARINNTVQGDPVTIDKLEGGKRYKLLCLIGVESIEMIVMGVEDWDFPMRFTPDTGPWTPVDYDRNGLTEGEAGVETMTTGAGTGVAADTTWQVKVLNEDDER